MDDPQTQQQEPSMEEILASIRRIISEDAAEPDPDEPPPPPDEPLEPEELDMPAVEPEPEPVVALEVEDEPPPPEESFSVEPPPLEPAALEADDDILELTNVVDGPPPQPAGGFPSAGRYDDGDSLISDRTADLAQSALARLNGSGARVQADMPIGDGRTVEDLVRELLKPMLREWLDANLPEIVERLVDREVQYIGRGGGRR